jgi:hypothetical protein
MKTRNVAWDAGNLRRRLCHVLDFAALVVERLARDGYTDAVDAANSIRPEKVISETALLIFASSTAAASSEVHARVDAVAQQLLPHARSERMRLGVCLEPALALDYAQAHICLTRIGYPDLDFDELLVRSGRSQAHGGRERTPHRMLEQEWLRAGWDEAARSQTPRLARASVLGRPMDLLGGSREDLYAFTHALMYVRDFNVRAQSLPRPRRAILAEADAALARCLDDDDYDLAGEILLAWPLTGTSWSAGAAFAFHVLAQVEDEAGFLPAPSTRLDRLNALEGSARQDYFLATAYHTVFVMGLLCATALQPGRLPPAEIPPGRCTRHAANPFLEQLHAHGRHTRWSRDFDALSGPRRDTLAGFLLNVALSRSVKARDFASLHALLAKAHELGLADSPSASQAAELLDRMATFASLRERSDRSPTSSHADAVAVE